MSRVTLVAVLVIALMLMTGLTTAQNNIPYEPAFIGNSIIDFEWLPDSQFLKFKTENETQPYNLYSIAENEALLVTDWMSDNDALYAILKTSDPNAPIFVDAETGQIGYIYASPNQQFMVYSVDTGGTFDYGVAITDIITRQTQILENVRIRYPADYRGFYVRWSGNSQAFTLESSYGVYDLSYYMSDFFEDVSEIQVVDFDNRENPVMTLTDNTVVKIYDIDYSGNRLLIHIILKNLSGRNLIALNMLDYSYELITTGSFRSPAFERPNYTSINYLDMDGIFNYDLVSQETRLRNADINQNWVSLLAFSPDGKYIALERINLSNYLYILEIEPVAPAN